MLCKQPPPATSTVGGTRQRKKIKKDLTLGCFAKPEEVVSVKTWDEP